MRSLKIGLESRIGRKIEMDERIIKWMVEHATVLMNGCTVGKDGKTGYRQLYGQNSSEQIVQI